MDRAELAEVFFREELALGFEDFLGFVFFKILVPVKGYFDP
jgi:hypothetical protein